MGVKESLLGKLLGSADKFSDEQVAQTIALLLEHGVKRGATDIHVEPHERFALVRYRIDGTLRGIHKLPVSALPSVIAECKKMAHITGHTNEVPQEGQFTTLVGEDSFEVQLATIPVFGGEKLVMHLSRRLSKPLTLEQLGFWGHSLESIKQTLSRPQGLILVSGPKRAGKATTMYSLVAMLNTPTVSIATVEDNIAFHLTGASQLQVKPHAGITFQEGVRAVLNQDPNVIMISNVPNGATAELAVQAATGGHLVIAGTHADSASAAITRLRSLHNENFLLGSSLRLVISQRLVRKLCGQCRERIAIDAGQIQDLEKTFGINSAATKSRLHELEQNAAISGVGSNRQLHTAPTHVTHLWQAHEDGCEACDHSGYRGMVALTEVLEVTDKVKEAIIDQAHASAIHQIALKEGFIPLGLDGLVKALRGETTVQEVLRTVRP